MTSSTVLLVEDNDINRDMLTRRLTRALQAQFLIPMATTIVFGLAFTTALVLFVVPATLGIGRDLSALFGGVWRFARALW